MRAITHIHYMQLHRKQINGRSKLKKTYEPHLITQSYIDTLTYMYTHAHFGGHHTTFDDHNQLASVDVSLTLLTRCSCASCAFCAPFENDHNYHKYSRLQAMYLRAANGR